MPSLRNHANKKTRVVLYVQAWVGSHAADQGAPPQHTTSPCFCGGGSMRPGFLDEVSWTKMVHLNQEIFGVLGGFCELAIDMEIGSSFCLDLGWTDLASILS